MKSTKQERDMIKAIQQKRLFDELMPVIQKIIKHKGSADQIFKESAPFAAAQLAHLAFNSEKEEVRRQAAKDLLEHGVGKPVERSLHLYGDLNKKSDNELEAEIERLLRTQSNRHLPAPKIARKRASRRPHAKEIIIEASHAAPTTPEDSNEEV